MSSAASRPRVRGSKPRGGPRAGGGAGRATRRRAAHSDSPSCLVGWFTSAADKRKGGLERMGLGEGDQRRNHTNNKRGGTPPKDRKKGWQTPLPPPKARHALKHKRHALEGKGYSSSLLAIKLGLPLPPQKVRLPLFPAHPQRTRPFPPGKSIKQGCNPPQSKPNQTKAPTISWARARVKRARARAPPPPPPPPSPGGATSKAVGREGSTRPAHSLAGCALGGFLGGLFGVLGGGWGLGFLF